MGAVLERGVCLGPWRVPWSVAWLSYGKWSSPTDERRGPLWGRRVGVRGAVSAAGVRPLMGVTWRWGGAVVFARC